LRWGLNISKLLKRFGIVRGAADSKGTRREYVFDGGGGYEKRGLKRGCRGRRLRHRPYVICGIGVGVLRRDDVE